MKIISIALLFSSVAVDASDKSSSTSSLRKKQSSPHPPKKKTPTRRQEESSLITLEQVSLILKSPLGSTPTSSRRKPPTSPRVNVNIPSPSADRDRDRSASSKKTTTIASPKGGGGGGMSVRRVKSTKSSKTTKSLRSTKSSKSVSNEYPKKTALDGFYFFPLMESGGNDIEKSNRKSVLDYAEDCHADPECKGFNSNGWLKYEIKPFDEWYRWTKDASKGLYVKKA